MSKQYEVVRYGASGSGDQEKVVATDLTLEDAKHLADKGFGSWFPPNEDGIDGVIAYHESDEDGCGGYLVREVRE